MKSEPLVRDSPKALVEAAITTFRKHLHIFAADVRQTPRVLAKAPGFVFAALLTVVLGISATTAVFSLLHAVLIRSLPYGNPERLVYMWTPAPGIAGMGRERQPFYQDMVGWQKMSHSLTSITSFRRYMAVLNDGTAPRVGAAKVLGNFFDTLAVSPQLGRTIDATDDHPGKHQVAVISEVLWRARFGGDPNVIGTIIRVDGQPYRVIGIMPREFSYPHGNDFPGQYQFASLARTDLWVPAALTPKQQSDPEFDDMDAVIGRLGAGITLAQAQPEVAAIEKHLNSAHPEGWRSLQTLLVPFLETTIGPVRPLLRLLTGAVSMILLMACGNFASLLLARAASRAHELGVRAALGAERWRLIWLMLTESLMLSVTGGVLAMPLSYAVLKAVVRLNPGDIPGFEETTLDTRLLLFGLFLALATGLFSAILPAVSASRVHVGELLRNTGQGMPVVSMRVRNLLIVSEIAFAVVLLAGAGLLIRSYLTVQGEDKGFAQSTLTMSVLLDKQIPHSDTLRHELMDQIRAIRGVQAAGSIDDLPLSTYEDKGFLEVEGHVSSLKQLVAVRETAGDYFRAMQIPLLEGRYLNDSDISRNPKERARTVVVSQSFVKRFLASPIAVGRRLRINGSAWSTIVGVLGDVRHSSLEEAPQPTIYYQNGLADSIAIRSAGTPDRIIPAVRRAASELNAGVTVTDVQTMDQYVNQAAARRRFQTVALVSFATVAVFLALAGFYGLLSYAVSQRTGEVGVRMALGASPQAVIAMVVRYGLQLTSTGLAIGLCAALLLTRAMASLLYGVHPIDPITFILVPVFMIAAAVIACIAPAWRAAMVDPVSALRS